jgi:hypothetical protein
MTPKSQRGSISFGKGILAYKKVTSEMFIFRRRGLYKICIT